MPFFFSLAKGKREREKLALFPRSRRTRKLIKRFVSFPEHDLKRTNNNNNNNKNERGYFHPHRPSRGANRCADVSLLFLPFLSLRARISLSLSFACEMATTLLTFFFRDADRPPSSARNDANR